MRISTLSEHSSVQIGNKVDCLYRFHENMMFCYRRARENGGMLTKLAVEKRLLRKELTSRLLTGKIFTGVPKGDYVPVGFDKTTMRA